MFYRVKIAKIGIGLLLGFVVQLKVYLAYWTVLQLKLGGIFFAVGILSVLEVS